MFFNCHNFINTLTLYAILFALLKFRLLHLIKKSTISDFTEIYGIINDAASAYKGIIPEDRWHEPYMPKSELQKQIDDAVEFWCYFENNEMLGVMGIQDKIDVILIRHAYVRTKARNKGIGSKLLRHLSEFTKRPILIGTWADADWAIKFYEKHGFQMVSFSDKERLLRKYWSIPLRQIETSVVLANIDSTNLD
jgi:GNAT superfamily N-acetyltransferase